MLNRIELFNYSIKYNICRVLSLFSDDLYLKLFYYAKFKRKLNVNNPVAYTEKIQWLKLHDRKKLYIQLVDKYEAKRYAADRIGMQYIIPTLGIWDSVDGIEFDKLPDTFVLKCTHDSGSAVICDRKDKYDRKTIKRYLKFFFRRKYYYTGREWPYKNIKHRIIAEQFIYDKKDEELRDYKFLCFNGTPHYMFIATNRQGKGETYFDFYDMEGNHLNIVNGHPNADSVPHLPEHFEEMKVLATKLSAGIPHVRIDFYEANNKVYFGEFTLYHWSGFRPFKPEFDCNS